MTRPFLKWPGGKYRLIDTIIPVLPTGKCLAEPFVGAGAVFLNTDYSHYLLNDINPDVITLFNIIKSEYEKLSRYAKKLFTPNYNCEKKYYALREKFNESSDPQERSILFLYLNRHGYNGLVRYNQSGIFNVPFGRYKKPYFPEDEMAFFHKKAQRAEFFCLDFKDFMQTLPKKTIVYCDPPYVPLSATSEFTQYSGKIFSLEQQIQLALCAKKIAQNGSRVLISNHATPFTHEIYAGASIFTMEVRRSISCQSDNRGLAPELLALF